MQRGRLWLSMLVGFCGSRNRRRWTPIFELRPETLCLEDGRLPRGCRVVQALIINRSYYPAAILLALQRKLSTTFLVTDSWSRVSGPSMRICRSECRKSFGQKTTTTFLLTLKTYPEKRPHQSNITGSFGNVTSQNGSSTNINSS